MTSQLAATSDIDLARQAEIGSLQKALVERESDFVHTQNLLKQQQQQVTVEKNEVQRCQKELSEAAAAFKLQAMHDNPPVNTSPYTPTLPTLSTHPSNPP